MLGNRYTLLVMETIFKYIFNCFFIIMIIGNISWLIILDVIGSALNVSWLEVEHAIKPFGFVSYKEMMIRNGKSQEYINKVGKNIWDKK